MRTYCFFTCIAWILIGLACVFNGRQGSSVLWLMSMVVSGAVVYSQIVQLIKGCKAVRQ